MAGTYLLLNMTNRLQPYLCLQSPSMKPILTQWGGLSNQEVFTIVHQKVELMRDAAMSDKDKQIFFLLMPRTWFKVEEFRVASLSLVSFCHLSALGQDWLISCIIIYHLLWSALYHIAFSPVCCGLEFSSLEVKYDIFRYGDEGTWQSTQINIHNTRSLIRTSQVCLEHLAVRRSFHVGRINTHTHTHTHTHMLSMHHKH